MSHADPIIDKIIIARVGLLLRHPFFGNLATRLKIEEGSEWMTTAATDGRTIYFNREFFEPLSIKQVEFVIAHEILHTYLTTWAVVKAAMHVFLTLPQTIA